MKIPARVDPAVSFTCATCKRILPLAAKNPGRLVCADWRECSTAAAEALAKVSFVHGVVTIDASKP